MLSHNLYCVEKGEGPYRFLLLHNAGGNHHFVASLIPLLSHLGLTLAVDLPGHGRSPLKPDGDYSIRANAENLYRLIAERGGKWVIVGLNYGGNVALEMSLLYPDAISHLILIDPPLMMSPAVREMIESHIIELDSLNPLTYAKTLVQDVMLKGTKTAVDIAIESFQNIPRNVLIAVYQDLLEWDKESARRLKEVRHQTLDILTSQPFYQGLHHFIPQLNVGQVVGSGFWATLEVPDQVAAMIERFLALT